MAKPIFHHRTSRFQEMFTQVNESLKKVYKTKNDVLTIAGSGTAGMEAAMACAIPRDKKVMVVNGGKFGERWVKVAKRYKLQVDEVKVEWGTAIQPEQVKERVATGQYGAVVLVYSETSTCTACDLKAIAKVVAPTDALLIVDGITAVGSLALETDEWGVDLVASGSQKAFMLPPGLAFVSVSEKAWKVIDTIEAPGVYLDLKAYRKTLPKNDTPYTPAITLIRGLQVALNMINDLGIDKVVARTAILAKALRAGCDAIGMKTYSKQPSDSVTGIYFPPGVDDSFRKALRTKYGCSVAGGQDDLLNKIFRANHMGYTDPLDTIGLMAAIEYTVADLGAKVDIGAGVAATARVLKDWK